MSIQIENNEDREMCKKCGGSCCRNMGCHYSPDDFDNITYESLKEKIEEGYISIDWWDGNPFDEEDEEYEIFENKYINALYLRIRNEDADIVDPSWGGRCSLLTDEGCSLSFEERPMGAKALYPNYPYGCEQNYTKHQCAKDWFKYEDILIKLKEEFE